MIDVAEANARDVDISLDTIADEVKAGLPLHADRLVEAFDNEEYYAGRNAAYIARREAEDWRDLVKRPRRTSKILRKVIRALANIYAPGPHRKVKGDAAADRFLDDIYQANHINDLMMAADRKANLNGLAAIQAHVTGRPAKPLQLYLWGAHEIVAWTLPDDPTTAWAIATVTRQRQVVGKVHRQQLRYELWSATEHRVYLTDWMQLPSIYDWAKKQYSGLFTKRAVYQRALSGLPAGSGENPYGVLPFSFVHDEMPVSDFYEGGIGCALRECNAEVDRELSDLAQHAREFMDPDRFTLGVSAAWRREKRPGNWQSLTPNRSTLEDGGVQPSAFLVQAALAVDHVWYNITTYANQTLEDLDVPVAAIRADSGQHLSGIAIVAKHLPLLERARARQPRFTVAETDLARVVLTVAGRVAPGEDIDFDVTWPTPKFALPSPEQDQQDTWLLDNGVKSLVDVVAERGGFTTDQAKDQIKRVAEDNTWLATVLVPPVPLPGLPGTISGLTATGASGNGNLDQGK